MEHNQTPLHAIRHGRHTGIYLSGFGDICRQTTSTSDLSALGYSNVSGGSRLASHDNVILECGATRNAYLGAQDAVTPHDYVVSDLDLIVYFGALAYHGATESRPIERRIRSDFDITFDHNDSDLRDLGVFSLHHLVTKSVGANHHATM